MIDLGILATGIAASVCLAYGRSTWVARVLFGAWLSGALAAMYGLGISMTVLLAASLDLIIAITALIRLTMDQTKREAQIVGLLSLSLMPAHSIMALSRGSADWTLYVSACNALFVLQCLTAGGWLDGLGRGIAGFWRRMRPFHPVRDRGR